MKKNGNSDGIKIVGGRRLYQTQKLSLMINGFNTDRRMEFKILESREEWRVGTETHAESRNLEGYALIKRWLEKTAYQFREKFVSALVEGNFQSSG